MSSSSILELPTSKQDFGKFVKQQRIDKNSNNVSTTKETESKATTFGAASFFYKLTEIVALTSTAFSETYNTLTAGGTIEQKPSTRKRRDYKIVGDVMQINADDSDGAYDDDEMSDEIDCNGEEINKKTGRKDEAKWAANDDEEEPPPPYDSSWALPKNKTHDAETNPEEDNLKDSPMPSPKGTDSNVESDSASTSKDVQYSPTASPRRRQIRVGRSRRLIRKMSKPTLTEASTPKKGEKPCDDPDKLLLKVNDKLSDMIAQGRAALTSTVELTEADILMAEEKEREEKIMKELGQPPIGRRGRKNTSYSDDYFTTISDGNYSSPESLNEFGGYGAYNGFVSNGYVEPNIPKGFVNGPVSGGFGGSARFARFGPNSNNGGFGTNYGPSFGAPNVDYSSPEQYEYGYNAYNGHGNGFVSNGFVEPTIPKGFGAGPVSGGFGGPARFGGRFGASNNNNNSGFGASNNNNNGFGTNYGSFAPSNVGGYTSGMYNNREFIY